MTLRSSLLLLGGALILGAALLLWAWIERESWAIVKKVPVTLDDLPPGAVFVPHPEDEETAKRLEKIAMKHYATPEAQAQGGPIYGAFGYGIVSIEYEIPLSSLGIREVGESDSGYLLALPEILEKGKNIPYDHFHIGYSQHAHDAIQEPHGHEADEERLIIHFMLIPHTVEAEHGLYCG